MIQISTDYSFDGTATEPYTESSPTKAIGAYGRTKLAGELAVAEAATPDFAIVRSSWLFGPHGKNFVDTILRAGAERGELKVVHDQVGCPTYTGHLAQALVEIAERRLTGILHVAGSGSCSWYDLAVAALEAAGVECTVTRDHRRRVRPPGAAPGLLRARLRARRRAPPARLAGRPGRPPGRRRGRWHEAARLRRGRLHRLDLRAPARRRVRRRRDRARQADLRGPAREPRGHRAHLRARRHRGPRRGRRGDGGRRRGRQLRRRDARGPLDRRARRVRDHARARHLRAAGGGARARPALRAGLHRRGLRLDRGGQRSRRRPR